MTTGLINWVLDKCLNNILEINKELTKSSLFSGEIILSNLKIKPDIFTFFSIPFYELIYGIVGKFRIKVQLPRIHLHPIKFEIDNVFVHAKQKKLSNLNKEKEIKFMEDYKISQLQSLEEFKNELNNCQDESSLLSRLINNLEITVNNVCIRVDDDISYELTPFCFGILIKNIKYISVDKEFKEVEGKYSLPFEEINNKKVEIDKISVFLDTFENYGILMGYEDQIVNNNPNTIVKDEKLKKFLGKYLNYYRYCLSEMQIHILDPHAHNYILYDLGVLLKLSMNENLKNGKPKIEIHCKLKELKIELNLVQMKALFKMLIYQNFIKKYQMGLSKEYYNKKLSDREKMEYIDNYIEYYNYMYAKKPNEKKANKIKAILNQVEDKLNYEEIQVMRNSAETKMKHARKLKQLEDQIQDLIKETAALRKQSLKKKNKELELKEKEKLMEELEKKKLNIELKIINSIKKKLSHVELLSGFFPDDSGNFSLYRILVEVSEIQLNIKRIKEEKFMTIIFTQNIFYGDIKNRQQFITLTIGDISVIQYQLPNSKYQMILTTVEQKNDNLRIKDKNKINACYIEFEINPNFDNSNYRIKFRNQKRLIFIANILSYYYIGNKLLDYLVFFMDNNFDFPEKHNVSNEIYKFIKEGFKLENIEASQNHFNADLDITIKSPIILLPIDILDNSNKKCILVRSGDFRMFSLLPPRQDPKVNYAKIKQREKLFDSYVLKGEKLCVTTLTDFDGDLTGLLNAKGLNLVEDVSFGLNADVMFEQKNPYFEKFKLGVNVGQCKLNLIDIQLPFFMEMIEKFGKMIELATHELEQKTLFEKKEIKLNKEEEETYNIEEKKKKNQLELENELNLIFSKEPKININNRINLKYNENEIETININHESLNKLNVESEEIKIEEPKLLIFNCHLEAIRFCILKTISYDEKKILLKTNDENFKNLNYRDFLELDIKNFKTELLLTEKYNANCTLLIKSLKIFDKETLITNINNPHGDLYIDKEFQNIIQMDSVSNKKEIYNNPTYQFLMKNTEYNEGDSNYFSDLDEFKIDGNKNKNVKNNYEDYFMILKFQHNNETKTQDANVVLKSIKICLAMSTISRIYQFTFYYLDIFNEIIEKNYEKWKKMQKEHKSEKMKNKLMKRISKNNSLLLNTSNDVESLNSSFSSISDNYDDESYEEIECDDANKLYDSRSSQIAEEINKKKEKQKNEEDMANLDTNSIIKTENSDKNIINVNNNNEKNNNDGNKEVENSQKNDEIKLTKIFRKKNKKMNIKIKLELKELLVTFPLNDSQPSTKVLSLKSNINGNIYLKTDIDLIRNGLGKLVNVNFNENNLKTGIKVLNVEFNMLNYKDGKYSVENIRDTILKGFRFCININSILLLPEKNHSVTLLNIDLEPLVFNINLTQVKSFIRFIPILEEFLDDLEREYDDPIKEMENYQKIEEDTNYSNSDKDSENNIINLNELISDPNIIVDSQKNHDIINIEEENKKKEKKIIKKRNKRKKELKQIEQKSEGNTQINIEEINNTIDLKINIEKILVKIIDDSGYYLQSLLNIELRLPLIKFILNSNNDSVKNISNLLVESISRKEIPLKNYDIKDLALYGEINFSFSVTFYNNRIDDWEPIIEKYEACMIVDQIAWFSRLRIIYNSNDMFNLNISFSSLCLINDVLKKVFGGLKGSKSKKILENIDDRIAVEFINLSGINICCWLDAEDFANNLNNDSDKYKFTLYSNENSKNCKKIKRSELNEIYNQLSEAQLKIKKGKFSFRIDGYLPIRANDFSSNYNTCFKLKKDLGKRNMALKENIDMKKKNKIEIKGDEQNLLLLDEKLLPKDENEIDIIDTSNNKMYNNLNNENINGNNSTGNEEIEIFIKIRKNKFMKSITFESNIFFYNNLQIPISLSLISQEDFQEKYNLNDSAINHEKNKEKIIIEPGTKKSLPLIYLIKKHRIYISFENNLNNYSLLYKNFNELNKNYENFIKYEQENLPTYKGKKETYLNDNYSKLVTLKYKNKIYYITSNLIIQHGINDKIIPENNKENNNTNININQDSIGENNLENKNTLNIVHDLSNKKSFRYLFILNESISIENQLPFTIKCELDGNIKKAMTIGPLQNKYFLDFNKDNTLLKISFTYQNKNFKSYYNDIKELYQNQKDKNSKNKDSCETSIKLYEEINGQINPNEYLESNIKIEEDFENDKFTEAYEKEFEHNVISFPKKIKVIIYSKFLVINKTDFFFLISSQEDVKKQNFNPKNFNGRIFQNSINLLNTNDIRNSFLLKSENSNWSEKFNINTIGQIGVISLEEKGENNRITNIEISVSIASSTKFQNSLFVTIEPRFLLINRFGYDLTYKQYNNKKDKISNDNNDEFPNNQIKNGEEIKINLLKGSKKMKKMIQLKLGDYSMAYSCPIDLDETGDVDIKIPINKEMKKKILKKNIEIKKIISALKRKERLKKKMQFIEERKKEEENIKINEEEKENENNIINDDNILSSKFNNFQEININPNDDNDNDEEEILINIFSFSQKIEKFISKRTRKGRKKLTASQEKEKKTEERNKKLRKFKMEPRKFLLFSQNNEYYLLLRISKYIHKGLIYIVIFPPKNPSYMIKNQTNSQITIRQKDDNFNQEKIILEKGDILPYTWGDTLKNEKLLYISIDNIDTEINLNEIKVFKKNLNEEFLKKNKLNIPKKIEAGKTFIFQSTIENNKTRTLIVKSKHQREKNQVSFLERIKKQKNKSFNVRFKFFTKGFGISVINSEPKELFYISFYGLLIDSQLFNFNKEQCNHIISNIKISLKNIQFDYCLKDIFKSTIIPNNPITPPIEELNKNNDNNDKLIPLFQGIISFHRINNHLISVTSDEFPQLDFTIQPIKLNVSNYQIISLLEFGEQLKSEFDFYLTDPEKIKKFNNIDQLEKFLSEENSKNNKEDEYEPDYYSSLLNIELTKLPEEIIFKSEQRYLFFIKNIAIGSLVIILTTRLDLNTITEIPIIISGLSSFIGNIFTHISDYNLYLPSLYFTDVFTDIDSLAKQLKNAYLSQIKRRIFKIIGSLDILGNPTSYATSISKGFLEIFEAPRKGLIQGPLGFGEGVAKGFGKFIATLITSSFDLVGKISGTLLTSCEELQGIKNTEDLYEREPSNILAGLYLGVKNGIMDIGKGFAGIFIRPYEEAKRSGIGGFFQGMGAGLLGAAISPFTAGLRLTNNLVIGIKNTALIFNPRLKTERFRYPRTIQKAIRLNSYNEDEALVKAILDYLTGYEDHEIIYFKQFKYIHPGLQGSLSTLILTDRCVMIVYQAKELVFEIQLDSIKKVEVHQEPNNTNIDLIFYLKNDTKEYIITNDLSLCVDFYLMFENIKE